MNIAVIIPSRSVRNIEACTAAVRKHEPKLDLIVVDDGIEWPPEFYNSPPNGVVRGEKPFIFARNINRGIAHAAKRDGYVLLNDDALLQTPGGFQLLAQAAENATDYGVISAGINGPRTKVLLEPAEFMVPFVCVYIPRRTIDAVGLLDEQFTGYGYEDDDYCLRVRRAGMRVGTMPQCHVEHGSLPSTFRVETQRPPGLALAREIFVQKWGSHPL